MRVNIYAEELTDRIQVIGKVINGRLYTGLRIWLALPTTIRKPTKSDRGLAVKGPFIHKPGDDDSSAITIWGKSDLRPILKRADELLYKFYRRVKERGLAVVDKESLKDFGSDGCNSVYTTLGDFRIKRKKSTSRKP